MRLTSADVFDTSHLQLHRDLFVKPLVLGPYVLSTRPHISSSASWRGWGVFRLYCRWFALNGCHVPKTHADTWIVHAATLATITDCWKKCGADRYQFGLRQIDHLRLAPVGGAMGRLRWGIAERRE